MLYDTYMFIIFSDAKNKSDEENVPPAVPYVGEQTPQGSVISVKEASKEDTHNNVQV